MGANLRRLKAERVARGLTQKEMALRLGLGARSNYAKRENGTVQLSVDELAKIGKIFNMKPNELGIFFTLSVPKKEKAIGIEGR